MRNLFVITALSAYLVAASPVLWSEVCTQSDVKSLDFCNTKLSHRARAEAYVGLLTLEEKEGLFGNGAKNISRLHIPMYQWGSEGLHGPLQPCVCDAKDPTACKCPTSFPAPSAMGSAFNNTLYKMVGHADGIEARAINNLRDHVKQNKYGDGIDYWSPTINMQRDPRWGRNQEVPGEDPTLTSGYATNFVQGLQNGADPSYVQIIATCKHFIANSLERWNGFTRHNFDAQVSKKDLADYYAVPFKACVTEGKALGIMCSYNSVNGVPMCGNSLWLNNTLRNTWGFDGYVTSDCGAIRDIYTPQPKGHGYVKDADHATKIGLEAGCDVDCGGIYPGNLVHAVNAGLVKKETVDTALTRLTMMQMKLGLFDPKEKQQYFNYGIGDIDTPAHQQLALEAAQQSIVLLKNKDKVLPLSTGKKIAVIGPHVNATVNLISNYHGSRCVGGGFDCIQTPFAAVTSANVGGTTTSSLGCEIDSTKNEIAQAVAAANAADVVVLTMGLDQSQETEGRDRIISTLPGLQIKLAQSILAVKKPTILVLIHGGAMSLGPLKDEFDAIVDAFYGGEMASQAIADVLFGKYNPSGKLAVTMYPPDYVNKIPLTNMNMSDGPGRTHLYYTGTPEFKFGTGLSYSSWHLELDNKNFPSTVSTVKDSMPIHYSLRLRNSGSRAGKQTVLAFWRPVNTTSSSKLKQKLFAYQGIYLDPSDVSVLEFKLSTNQLAMANEDGDRMLNAGQYEVFFQFGHEEATVRLSLSVLGPSRMVEAFPAM